MKVELVLRAAEALLATCQEGQKPEILAQLKDIKSQWEETVTYMTHCHRWGWSGDFTATCLGAGDPVRYHIVQGPLLERHFFRLRVLGTACALRIQARASF